MNSTRINLFSLMFISIFLVACSSNIVGSEEVKTGDLTVMTVEFNSGAPVPDLLISLEEVPSAKEVDTKIGSIEGVAVFEGLQEGKTYKIIATKIENGNNDDYSSVEEFTFKSSSPYFVLRTHANNYQQLAVPVVMQNPELPNGCEITSLTAVLNYYGFQLSKTEMTDRYLPQQNFRNEGNKKYGADPNKAFTGSPYEKKNATYVFASPIVKAAKAAIKENNLSLQVTNVSGQSSESILNLLDQGVPVIVWVTLDLSEPRKNGGWFIDKTNKFHEMYQNLHSVVLIGQSDDNVIVMDPLKGYVEHNIQQFFKSYEELGTQAVAIHK